MKFILDLNDMQPMLKKHIEDNSVFMDATKKQIVTVELVNTRTGAEAKVEIVDAPEAAEETVELEEASE